MKRADIKKILKKIGNIPEPFPVRLERLKKQFPDLDWMHFNNHGRLILEDINRTTPGEKGVLGKLNNHEKALVDFFEYINKCIDQENREEDETSNCLK